MFTRKKMSESENIAPMDSTVTVGGVNNKGLANGPNKAVQGKAKRGGGVGQARRPVLGDVVNAEVKVNPVGDGKKKIPVATKAKVVTKTTTAVPKAIVKPAIVTAGVKKGVLVKKDDQKKIAPPQQKTKTAGVLKSVPKAAVEIDTKSIDLDESLPLDRQEEDISVIEEDDLLTFDRENYNDVFHVGIYAQDIFNYYKNREKLFHIPPYMSNCEHPITPAMRAILVDWMVEIQENFELNHETLYLGVKLTDLYLSRKRVTKESLQLVGSVSLFIASKFDEQRYPMIEDFTYVCDNAFDRSQFIEMEIDLLRRVDFDLGIPISYRFLRRYAKVGKLSMETLTLSRFILEQSLMEAEFISEKDSKVAAAALFLAMKMRHEGKWFGDLVKASGYELKDFRAIVIGLNTMMLAPNNPQLMTVKCKYSHSVFYEVAKIPTVRTEKLLL